MGLEMKEEKEEAVLFMGARQEASRIWKPAAGLRQKLTITSNVEETLVKSFVLTLGRLAPISQTKFAEFIQKIFGLEADITILSAEPNLKLYGIKRTAKSVVSHIGLADPSWNLALEIFVGLLT
ncbi:predicted protein [Histoplasma capsulatum var. duboisii H88]|uniref:Predicted protein n=1 Tax=Ajellomyces capsulatus (strain H88) TaxID=544711 RepID=F0UI87_AJEC8|nr:predicted protein [Histoplasma capsulatum var. duboisii H88]